MSEGQALCICHTSGTTGAARGGRLLAPLGRPARACARSSIDSHGVARDAVVLPLTPMFHLMAWGLPYSSALAPARLVLGGRGQLARRAGVADRVASASRSRPGSRPSGCACRGDRGPRRATSPRCAASSRAAPRLRVRSPSATSPRGSNSSPSWGMTEAGSGTTLRPGSDSAGAAPERHGPPGSGDRGRRAADRRPRGPRAAVGRRVGRRATGARAMGRRAYLDDAEASARAFDDGWLRTGDVARIDSAGSVEIVDRLKDLIKSGGEWISSTELEGHLARQPGVGGGGRDRRRRRDAGASVRWRCWWRAPASRSTATRCATASPARSRAGGCRSASRCLRSCRRPRSARSTSSVCASASAAAKGDLVRGRPGMVRLNSAKIVGGRSATQPPGLRGRRRW